MKRRELVRQLTAAGCVFLRPGERGCLKEERVLKGDLAYESSMPRLAGDEERFVLRAMHQNAGGARALPAAAHSGPGGAQCE